MTSVIALEPVAEPLIYLLFAFVGVLLLELGPLKSDAGAHQLEGFRHFFAGDVRRCTSMSCWASAPMVGSIPHPLGRQHVRARRWPLRGAIRASNGCDLRHLAFDRLALHRGPPFARPSTPFGR